MRKSLSTLFWLSILLFLLTRCTWTNSERPSILIVTVENLGFHGVRCDTPSEEPLNDVQLDEFCQESVRFTHATTPSIMSQATMASLLTGRYPFEHGVWHNGRQHLLSAHVTVPEVAIEKGYRTAFFSGGPPLWRKSGLSQGFETFDDTVRVSFSQIYRPVSATMDSFKRWLTEDVSGDPFFSVIFLADLQFPESRTKSDLGEFRSRSLESQTLELFESFRNLRRWLIKEKRWDSTYVVLVGLNGLSQRSRSGEVDGVNLHSERTRVAFLVKPAGKQRDKGLSWAVDKNVSLVDLGRTLYDLLGGDYSPSSDSPFEVASLKKSFQQSESTWAVDRPLLVESGWSRWRSMGVSRFAILSSNFLFFHDESPKLYNTLIDRFEQSPLKKNDPAWQTVSYKLKGLLEDRGYSRWRSLPSNLVQKLELAKRIWSRDPVTPEESTALKLLTEKRSWDGQVMGWRALLALRESNWVRLEKIGRQADRPLWTYVAKRNQGETFSFKPKGCEMAFTKLKDASFRLSLRKCDNSLILKLHDWFKSRRSKEKNRLREEFWHEYRLAKTDELVAQSNFTNGLNWDVPVDYPEGPLMVDLMLALPEMKPLASIIERRFSRLR